MNRIFSLENPAIQLQDQGRNTQKCGFPEHTSVQAPSAYRFELVYISPSQRECLRFPLRGYCDKLRDIHLGFLQHFAFVRWVGRLLCRKKDAMFWQPLLVQKGILGKQRQGRASTCQDLENSITRSCFFSVALSLLSREVAKVAGLNGTGACDSDMRFNILSAASTLMLL